MVRSGRRGNPTRTRGMCCGEILCVSIPPLSSNRRSGERFPQNVILREELQFHEVSDNPPALGLNRRRQGAHEITALPHDPSGHCCAGRAGLPVPAGVARNGGGVAARTRCRTNRATAPDPDRIPPVSAVCLGSCHPAGHRAGTSGFPRFRRVRWLCPGSRCLGARDTA